MRFFVGLCNVYDAGKLPAVFLSVNRLRRRRSSFAVGEWIMDSGAFSTIARHGGYPEPPDEYAAEIRRWSKNGTLLAAVAQDYMCEPAMLERTGLDVETHQALTIARYLHLLDCDRAGVELLPVLQGQRPDDYLRHLDMYGDRLRQGAWVGVGTLCKRKNLDEVIAALCLIHRERPDLRLHGFGLKFTGLANGLVRQLLYSADSMAWSYAARRQGRNRHDWREAQAFSARIETMTYQRDLGFLM